MKMASIAIKATLYLRFIIFIVQQFDRDDENDVKSRPIYFLDLLLKDSIYRS